MEQFRLTLETPSAILKLAAQRAIDLVSFGLSAAETATPEALKIPDVIEVIPASNHRMTVEEARTEFRSWTLANGLRDCVEVVGEALLWARRTCVMWSFPGTVTKHDDGTLSLAAEMTTDDWNSRMVEASRRFERLTITDKLRELDALGVIRPGFTADILSLNAARNCLAHRRGVVGPEDLVSPDDEGLTMSWHRHGLSVIRDGEEQAVGIGSQLHGERITVSVDPVTRTFAIGERINLSGQGFAEIALTFVLYGQQLEAAIRQMQEARYAGQAAPADES